MRLKLDRIGTSIGNRVDVGVRHTEAAVVRLRHFGDNQARIARSDEFHSFKRFGILRATVFNSGAQNPFGSMLEESREVLHSEEQR